MKADEKKIKDYEAYLSHRQLLIDGEHTSSDQFDKAVLVIATGSLYISLLFCNDNLERSFGFKSLLIVGWSLLAFTMLVILSSFFLSEVDFRNELDLLDKNYDEEKGLSKWEPSCTSKLIYFLKIISILSLVGGSVCIIVFYSLNII